MERSMSVTSGGTAPNPCRSGGSKKAAIGRGIERRHAYAVSHLFRCTPCHLPGLPRDREVRGRWLGTQPCGNLVTNVEVAETRRVRPAAEQARCLTRRPRVVRLLQNPSSRLILLCYSLRVVGKPRERGMSLSNRTVATVTQYNFLGMKIGEGEAEANGGV